MPMTVKRSKSKPEVEFQYGGRLFSGAESGDVSAMDWDIWSKSGMSIALCLLQCETWPNQKPEVNLRHYGCHLVKSMTSNSVGDHPVITLVADRQKKYLVKSMQNHMPMTTKSSE